MRAFSARTTWPSTDAGLPPCPNCRQFRHLAVQTTIYDIVSRVLRQRHPYTPLIKGPSFLQGPADPQPYNKGNHHAGQPQPLHKAGLWQHDNGQCGLADQQLFHQPRQFRAKT